MGTYGVYKTREDNKIRVQSANIPDAGVIEFTTDELDFKKDLSWDKFVRGVLYELKANKNLTALMASICLFTVTCQMHPVCHHLHQLNYCWATFSTLNLAGAWNSLTWLRTAKRLKTTILV